MIRIHLRGRGRIGCCPERPICLFFQQGKCNKGERCKFRHVATDLADAAAEAAAPLAAVDLVAKLPADLWLHVLSRAGVAGAAALSCCCTALAAIASTPELWRELRLEVFGPGGPPDAASSGNQSSGEAASGTASGGACARRECCVSEAALRGWARAASTPPSELPLERMTSVAIAGKLGVSTHDGRTVRLWEARAAGRTFLEASPGGFLAPSSDPISLWAAHRRATAGGWARVSSRSRCCAQTRG